MEKTEIPDGLCDFLQNKFGGTLLTGCVSRDADFNLIDIPSKVDDRVLESAILEYYRSHLKQRFSAEYSKFEDSECNFKFFWGDRLVFTVVVTNDTLKFGRILVTTISFL